MKPDLVEVARELAENVLYRNAIAVDSGEYPLRENLDVLARNGFYGMVGPREFGGSELDFQQACTVAEILAGGCLSTTLTMAQHHGTVMSIATQASAAMRDRWLADLCSGKVRSGVAVTGAIPGPAKLTARPTGDGTGFVVDGAAPWVSGWAMIDVLSVGARDENDDIVFLLADATESASLVPASDDLLVANASKTVTIEFHEHLIPADRLITKISHADWSGTEWIRKRANGSMAVGVAARCCALLADPAWSDELDKCREDLHAMTDLDAARARISEFALRAAAAVMVDAGSTSVSRHHHAQRLLREAGLLLVFGSRPEIRAELAGRLRP